MTIFEQMLFKITQNLHILQQREAKYGGNAPLELLNQIDDHQTAIKLTRQVMTGELSEAEWREALRPLLVAIKDRSVGEASSSVTIGDIEGGIHNSVIAGGDINIYLDSGQLKEKVKVSPTLSYEPETIIILGGAFWVGSELGEGVLDYETPPHKLNLQTYRIGKYPVTNEQFLEFVKQTSASVPPEMGWKLAKIGKAPSPEKLKHPVVGISWDEAKAYCNWLHMLTGRPYRLPTEAEWEKAARGSEDRRIYPWGNEWQDNRCNHRGIQTKPIDTYPPQHQHGLDPNNAIYDMVGNVWEWTSTLWGNEYAQSDFCYPYRLDDGRESPAAHPVHREYRVCRGGSYLDAPDQLRCSTRMRAIADERSAQCGFRISLKVE